MRKYNIVLIAGFLVLIATACQPTPKKDVVTNQSRDYLDCIVQTDRFESVAAPSTLDDRITSSTGRLELFFDCDIEMPEAITYSVYEAKQRQFSENEIMQMICRFSDNAELIQQPIYTRAEWAFQISEYQNHTEKVTDSSNGWLARAVGKLEEAPIDQQHIQFSLNDIKEMASYTTYFSNKDGTYAMAYGTKNGNDFCYIRDHDMSFYRQDILLADEDAKLLSDYEGEFAFSKDAALEQAKELLEAYNLSEMKLIDSQKLCTYKYGLLMTKGWDFIFTHEIDGLPSIYDFNGTSFGGENLPLPTLCSPWGQEAVIISVDEKGIVCIDIRNAIQFRQKLAENVKLMPFDELKEKITEYFLHTYAYASEKIEESVIRITKIELCSCLVSAKNNWNVGRQIPSWLVYYEYSGKNEDAYTEESGRHHAATEFISPGSRYFNAINGNYIEPRITRDMIE
ncbi:MAG: DUF6034 family protein [Clostridia bacterium]